MHNDTIPRGLSFLAGAAAGLALGYYLHSEKGSALREQLDGHLGDLLEDLGERAHEQVEGLVDTLRAAVDQVLTHFDGMADASEPAPDTPEADDVIDTFEEVESAFDAGMERARQRLWKKFAAAGIEPK